MAEPQTDLVAASRISRRVDLKEIRLIELNATSVDGPTVRGALKPGHQHHCRVVRVDAKSIEVACTYVFSVQSAEIEVATAKLTYLLIYRLLGTEPAEASDIEHFANTNGVYHTWPFVRETVFSLTAKMGFPPYTLPVMSFLPRPVAAAAQPIAASNQPAE